MTTIIKNSNRIIKLHFKDDGKSLDITNKIVLVNIKNGDNVISKTIERHDYPDDGITHFILSKDDTNILDGECMTNISIISKQE